MMGEESNNATRGQQSTNLGLVPEDCIRVGNKLYNAKMIESFHPGEKIFIKVQ